MPKYTSQFVPTNFNVSNSVLGMLRQDSQQRDAGWEKAQGNMSEAMGAVASIPTNDIEGRNSMLENFQTQAEEIVARKGGDWNKASSELHRLAAMEKSKPWYQVNNQLQQADKVRRELSMNLDNIVVGVNPANMTVEQAQQMRANGEDPFTQSALSKSALTKMSGNMASQLASRLQNSPNDFKSILGGQYFAMMKEYGPSPENFEAFIASPMGQNMMSTVMETYPELAKADQGEAMNAIKQGMFQAIGKRDMSTVANRNFISDLEYAKNAGKSTPGQEYTQYNELSIEDTIKNISNKFNEARAVLDNNNNFDESKMNVKGKTGYTQLFGGHRDKEYKASLASTKAVDELKTDYKNIYDNVIRNGGTEGDFLNEAERIANSNAARLNGSLGFNDYTTGADLNNKLQEIHSEGEANTFINIEDGKGESKASILDRLGSGNAHMRMTSNGDILVEVPTEDKKDTETYKINEEALPDNNSAATNNLRSIVKLNNSYNVTAEEFEANPVSFNKNSKFYSINDNEHDVYRVALDRDKPGEMKLYKLKVLENGDILEDQEVQVGLDRLTTQLRDRFAKTLNLKQKDE